MTNLSKSKFILDLDDKRQSCDGVILTRIRANRDIPRHGVKKGDAGGFLEHRGNLTHAGDCWIHRDARVEGRSQVYGDILIGAYSWIKNDARVGGIGSTRAVTIGGKAHVKGLPYIRGDGDIGWITTGRRFIKTVTWFKSWNGSAQVVFHNGPPEWAIFCGSIEEFLEEARKRRARKPASNDFIDPADVAAELRAIAELIRLREAAWQKETV